MLHSFTRIFVHLVWATKNRQRILSADVRTQLILHLRSYANENGIAIDTLNVQLEHVHILINLMSNHQVDHIVKLLKGESSHWINSENLIVQKFAWQRGYGAFSVSLSDLERVRQYIRNQEEHHRIRSFSEEYNHFLRENGFQSIMGDREEQDIVTNRGIGLPENVFLISTPINRGANYIGIGLRENVTLLSTR